MNSCNRCGIGRIKSVTAPYIWRTGSMTSIITEVPALHCDVCGELNYDQVFVYSLHLFGDHDSENGGVEGIKMKSFELLPWTNIRRKASGDC